MGRSDFTRDAVSGWARLQPGVDLHSLRLIEQLAWAGRLAENLLERAATASGLRRRGDYEVLALLRRAEPQPMAPVEVAEALLTSPSGMTGKLDRLESQGLIERRPDARDRRAVNLHLTDTGRSLVDDAFTTGLALYEAMLGPFTSTERERLAHLQEKLLDRLEQLSGQRQPWNEQQESQGPL